MANMHLILIDGNEFDVTPTFPNAAQLDAIFATEQAAWQADMVAKYARYGGTR